MRRSREGPGGRADGAGARTRRRGIVGGWACGPSRRNRT